MRRIAAAMHWHPGAFIAEIGAGDGTLSFFATDQVGLQGHVYANEIDPVRLAAIRESAVRHAVTNLTIVRGSETAANLPENCCDAVFMRLVYHHFTKPADMNASVLRALRPNGQLAIADIDPTLLRRTVAWLKGHPADGIGPAELVRQLTAAGFSMDGEVDRWPGQGYCLLFRKAQLPGR